MPSEVAGGPDGPYLVHLFGLSGRVALVTGARQGIGRALALALGRAGAAVAATSRRLDQLGELRADLDRLGVEHLELELDVRSPAAVRRTVDAVVERFGRVDVVVNNAGLSIRKDAFEITPEEWDAVVETNLRGAFLVARESAGRMGEGGRIINLSSTFARSAYPRRAAYAASKAGLEQLTRVLAAEWAERRITVNAVALTTVETETRSDLFADDRERAERVAAIPLGRLGSVDDAAGAVILLAGPAGAFVTGETIVVDGGFTLGASR